MKPLDYRVADLSWLVICFEQKINHWTYGFLTLGGRLVLIKSVLEALPVYWFSLIKIPPSILSQMRRLMSNFLWGGTYVSKGLHLAKWEMLTWPYAMGGWNIKDLKGFNDALRTKNPWITLTGSGLWSHI